ncbi:MAG: ATP-binding cassette domain-containing protein [Candidatus Caldarchaeales archaeon]
MNPPLIRIEGLKKYFPIKIGLFGRVVGYVKAVDGISFNIDSGEVVSLVGESGSGKTTLAKCLLLLEKPTEGRLLYNNEDVAQLRGIRLRNYRRSVQAVFQNPFLSLDPRMNAFEILSEPVKNNMNLSKKELLEYVSGLLEMVGLDRSFPRQVSS